MKYFKCKEGVEAIKAIDKELERLHDILGGGDKKANGEIWVQIKKLSNTLDEISRKHNGLEY